MSYYIKFIITCLMLCSSLFCEENIDIAKREFKLALEEKDPKLKLIIYDRIIRYAPDFMPALYNRALLLMKKKSWAEAKIDLKLFIENEGRSFKAFNNLAYVEFKLGNKRKALELWQESYRITKNNVRLLKNLAMVNFSLDRKKEALFYLNEALKIKPNDLSLLKTKARSIAGIVELEEEVSFLRYYLSLNPEDIESIYRYISISEKLLGRSELFLFVRDISKDQKPDIRFFNIFLNLLTNSSEAEFTLGYLKEILNNEDYYLEDSEIDNIVRVIVANPESSNAKLISDILLKAYSDSPSIILLRAFNSYQKGLFKEARSLALEVLAVDEKNPLALKIYYNSFIDAGDEEGFLSLLAEMRDSGGFISSETVVAEIKILLKRGEKAVVRKLCQYYLNRFPADSSFQLMVGSMLYNEGLYDEAVMYFNGAYSLEESSPELGMIYVRLLYRHGDIEKSLEIIRKLFAEDEENIDVALLYVEILHEIESYALSRAIYEKLRDRRDLPDYDYYFSDFHKQAI